MTIPLALSFLFINRIIYLSFYHLSSLSSISPLSLSSSLPSSLSLLFPLPLRFLSLPLPFTFSCQFTGPDHNRPTWMACCAAFSCSWWCGEKQAVGSSLLIPPLAPVFLDLSLEPPWLHLAAGGWRNYNYFLYNIIAVYVGVYVMWKNSMLVCLLLFPSF